MIRAAVLAVLLVPAAVIGLDTPLVMADSHLDVTAGGSADVYEGSVGRLNGTVSGLDPADIPTYAWTHNGTLSLGITIANNTALSTTFNVTGSVEFNTQVTFTLTVNGGTSLPVAKTVVVNIQDSSGAFIATWETGTSPATVAFYVNGTDHIIDWGDGSERAVGTGWVSHLYVEAGQYRVIVDGSVDRLYHSFGDGTPEMLRYVDQWGDTEWSSMRDMFYGALNMEYRATDTPDLSRVTNMESMFSGATLFNGNISSWNVSSVTNMSSMFYYASDFKGDISSWNVSSVTSMSNMFFGAFDFNRSLNNWNVSSVLSMSGMFAQATSFNQSLNNWDVSGVTSMSSMFSYASSFNQTLDDWNVSAVTDMSNMFSGAEDFNQPLNNWDVSKVTNTDSMFEYASDFNGDISSWNVSAVTGMSYMLSDASSFNQTLNDWDVSKVTDMSYMFLGAKVFNQPLNGWNVSKVTNTDSMFENAFLFNQPLNGWDVSKVTNMYYMFSGAKVFNQPLNGWDVSKVTDMTNMFSGALSFEQNLGEWYILPAEAAYDITDASLNVTVISAQNSILDNHDPMYGIDPKGSHDSGLFNMTGNNLMFKSTPLSAKVYTVNVTAPGGDFGTNNHRVLDITVKGLDDGTLPAGAFVTTWNVTASPYIISIPVEVHTGGTLTIDWGDGTAAVEVTTNGIHSYTYSASGEYQVSMTGDLSRIILSNIGSTASKLVSIDQWGDIEWSSMKDAFAYTSNMKYNASDVPNLSGVSSMENMFNLASKFDGDLSEWNVSAVTYMRSVFLQASSFNGNVSTWNVAAVTDMNSMFHSASDFNGDISNWNVSAVTDMNGMFSDASAFNGDISSWNVAAVTSMNNMFSGASDFNGDISSWNVAAVTIMNGMFDGASDFNGDISEWDVSAVTGMHTMFLAASAFNQPLNSWNVSSVTNMDFMFLHADNFEQNLGSWYVVPADTDYDAATETSLVITTIAAQNLELDGHSHNYGIGTGTGDDSDLFAMTDSNLVFKDTTPSAQVYKVNVTAPGGDFGTNNHRVLDITVTGEDRPLSANAGPD